jgi:hypothetical protein
MSKYRRIAVLLVGTVAMNLGWEARSLYAEPPAAANSSSPSVERPKWRPGDHWIVETLTDRIQGGEPVSSTKPVSLRWEFRVAKFEKVRGRDCFRLEVECMTKGRSGPKSTLWCDRDTLFLRQFQTQIVFNGKYRTLQESYDCGKGLVSPVLASINVLPLAIPAFLPPGAKGNSFSYSSQALRVGAKDASVISFGHHVTQEVVHAEAKSMNNLSRYSKSAAGAPVVELRLKDGRQTVVQLWKAGAPWPIYSENGRTRAWLVPSDTQ